MTVEDIRGCGSGERGCRGDSGGVGCLSGAAHPRVQALQAGPQFGPAGPSNPVCARALALRAARVRPLSAATPGRAWPPHFLPPHHPLAYLGPFSNTPHLHPQRQPALRPSQGQGQHRSLPHHKPQSLIAAGQRRTSSPGKRGDRGEGPWRAGEGGRGGGGGVLRASRPWRPAGGGSPRTPSAHAAVGSRRRRRHASALRLRRPARPGPPVPRARQHATLNALERWGFSALERWGSAIRPVRSDGVVRS